MCPSWLPHPVQSNQEFKLPEAYVLRQPANGPAAYLWRCLENSSSTWKVNQYWNNTYGCSELSILTMQVWEFHGALREPKEIRLFPLEQHVR